MYWAVGIAPSKARSGGSGRWVVYTSGHHPSRRRQPTPPPLPQDDYWTTEVQPDNPYGSGVSEPNWQLQAIVIALSTGPNGPSDMIGGVNATLLRSTIMADGTTLKPHRPGLTVESALAAALTGAGVPDVRAAWTQLDVAGGGGYRWHFVLAAMLGDTFPLRSSDLGAPLSASDGYALFDYFQLGPGAVPAGSLPAVGGSFPIPHGQGQPPGSTGAAM
jgi:hypothetical protein